MYNIDYPDYGEGTYTVEDDILKYSEKALEVEWKITIDNNILTLYNANHKSAKWLQWIKNKKYPLWRIDILFSEKKYHDIHFITDGGWHFTNIKSPQDIEKKLKSFVHYKDFESSGLSIDDLKRLINEKKVMYNHKIDKKKDKWTDGEKLQTLKLEEMPKHIIDNYQRYKPWLDNI